MTQNFLFIDIDGPLLPGKAHLFPQNRAFFKAFNDGLNLTELLDTHKIMFDPWAVRAHNLIAKYGDAKIVIVTNWRRWAKIEEIQRLFSEQGLEFNYADPVSCVKRGFSSERVHDVADHVVDYLPENSRALVIDDDHGLKSLFDWFTPENESDLNKDRLEKNIDFKLLSVDYQNGLSYDQFIEGMDFFEADMDQMKFHEFGIPIKTEEEKQKEREDFARFYHALIV